MEYLSLQFIMPSNLAPSIIPGSKQQELEFTPTYKWQTYAGAPLFWKYWSRLHKIYVFFSRKKMKESTINKQVKNL